MFPTPDDAEAAFYDAFERADLAAMMAVWAADDDIVCVHPQGPRLVGFDAVRESWTQIFATGTALRIRTVDQRRYLGSTMAVHSVVEMLSAVGEQGGSSPPVSATNVYVLTENGWRMTVHHASPTVEPARPARDTPPETHTLH
jgi:ketosteroid isomerase-like protein